MKGWIARDLFDTGLRLQNALKYKGHFELHAAIRKHTQLECAALKSRSKTDSDFWSQKLKESDSKIAELCKQREF